MTTPNTNTPTPDQLATMTAAFQARSNTSFHIRDKHFEQGTAAVYGKRIEILDSANDTTHEFRNVDGAEPDSHVKKKLDQAIADGDIEAYQMDIVLNDLVRRGILEAGDYYIRVSW
jgi:hypothetical protein